MKKTILVMFAGLIFISCKKTWTCVCEVETYSTDDTGQVVHSEQNKLVQSIPDQRKSDAETICENNEKHDPAVLVPDNVEQTVDCYLED